MSLNKLGAQKRGGVGKGAARASRRQGFVPGVIYGGGEEPVPINIALNELLKILKKGRFLSTLCVLEIDGQTISAMPRDVQKNLLNELPTHVDFLRVKEGGHIVVEIPVEFINHDASPALKAGGTLNITRHTVELHCAPDNIPEKLVADLAGVNFNEVIKWSMLQPAGLHPVITGHDFAIATILSSASSQSADSATPD